MKRKRIGIFDSGFGGLHVMRSIVRTLPQYDYVYLGDSARAPYGDRPQKEIYTYTREAVAFLFAHGCELVILACNTASSEALRKIQRKCLPKHAPKKKVLGVLIPAAEEAVRKSKGKRIGVLATRGTVESKSFVRELAKLDPQIEVIQKACPLLVPLIEAGKQNEPETLTALERYLRPLLRKDTDTLILGCTHYGILERKIRDIVGPNVAIVSEAKIVPKKFSAYLHKHGNIEKTLGRNSRKEFYTTGDSKTFERLGSIFFGSRIRAKIARLH